VLSAGFGWWEGFVFAPPWAGLAAANPAIFWTITAIVILGLLFLLHRWSRRWAAKVVARRIERDPDLGENAPRVVKAFMRNVSAWRPFFVEKPIGWNAGTRERLDRIMSEADIAIQRLNDRFTSPSGARDLGKDKEQAAWSRADRR